MTSFSVIATINSKAQHHNNELVSMSLEPSALANEYQWWFAARKQRSCELYQSGSRQWRHGTSPTSKVSSHIVRLFYPTLGGQQWYSFWALGTTSAWMQYSDQAVRSWGAITLQHKERSHHRHHGDQRLINFDWNRCLFHINRSFEKAVIHKSYRIIVCP